MRYLPNLSSLNFLKGCEPWEFVPEEEIPPNIRADKKARDAWINLPSTKHYVYTMAEGVNPGCRISKAKNDESGNPIHSIAGLVADYDAKADEATVLKHAANMPIPPNWIERTFSSHWRFVWIFEVPILFPSADFARHFLEVFADIAFDPARGMIAFDKGAWLSPERMYTNACDWRPLKNTVIPKEVTQGWLVNATRSFKFTSALGLSIPLEVVIPELTKKYPKISEWPSDFIIDSQGPSFWVEGSTSPKSAIVKEQGILTFSDHATKGFYSWADLLGIEFVKSFHTDSLARATENIYFDMRHYHIKTGDGEFCPYDRADARSHLQISRKISAKAEKDGSSEIDKCLEYVRIWQKIKVAASLPFFPPGKITVNNEQVLNTSMLRVMQPAEGKAIWGPTGQFPWVSNFLDKFFSNDRQLPFFISWLAHFYQSALALKPLPGHALIFVGPPGTGKTFLTTVLIAAIFNGFRDGSKYLMGADAFGGELFETGIIAVDDAVFGTDAHSKRIFSEKLKKLVADRTQIRNTKYVKQVSTQWIGRALVTLNCDPESLQALPDMDRSNAEKMMFFRVADETIKFPTSNEVEKILAAELSWLCRFLADWVIPGQCIGEVRFGVKHYHEFELVESARLSGKTAGFNEILTAWKADWFKVNDKAEFWEGTAYALQRQFLLEPNSEMAMRAFGVDAIGRHLASLQSKGMHIESTSGEVRIWKIFKDKNA